MKINNLKWKVVYTDNLKEDLFAQTNYATLTIYVSTQVDKQNMERSLMHEIVHAYCYSYGIMFFESFDREQLCEFISHNISNLIRLYDEAIGELRFSTFRNEASNNE